MHSMTHARPEWSHPGLAITRPEGIEHCSPSTSWAAADHQITIWRIREDPITSSGESLVGQDMIRLAIEDLEGLSPHGDVNTVELDLSLSQARDLIAALTTVTAAISADYRAARP